MGFPWVIFNIEFITRYVCDEDTALLTWIRSIGTPCAAHVWRWSKIWTLTTFVMSFWARTFSLSLWPTGAGETAGGARGAETAGLRGVPEGEADDRRDRPQDLRGGPEVRHRDRVDCFILYLCVKDIKSFVCSKLKSLYILCTLRR